MRKIRLFEKVSVALAVVGALCIVPSAAAMKLKKQNLQELVQSSQSILVGEVLSVTDGFDSKRPYTEVTLKVASDTKGKVKEDSTYTFRQFGLLKPRSLGNGKVYLGVTPQGFAQWNEGEHVVAFMYKPASLTGFQTTVGLAQGKFVVSNGHVSNQFGNLGLFDEMDVSGLSPEQQNLLTTSDVLDYSAFMGLVGKLAGAQ